MLSAPPDPLQDLACDLLLIFPICPGMYRNVSKIWQNLVCLASAFGFPVLFGREMGDRPTAAVRSHPIHGGTQSSQFAYSTAIFIALRAELETHDVLKAMQRAAFKTSWVLI